MANLDDYLKEVLARRRARLGEPPTPEQMIAYHEGRLGEDEEEELLDYASIDPETARALLDVVNFPNLDPVVELSAEDREAAWQRFRDRLPAREEAIRPSSARRWWQHEHVWPIAAALIVAAGLGFFVGTWQQPTIQPSAHPLITPLLAPEGSGGTRSADSLSFAEEAKWAIVRLSLEHPEPRSHYRVELRDASGRVPWQAIVRVEQPERLDVVIPRSLLTTGSWRILLFGDAEEGEPLAAYALPIAAD